MIKNYAANGTILYFVKNNSLAISENYQVCYNNSNVATIVCALALPITDLATFRAAVPVSTARQSAPARDAGVVRPAWSVDGCHKEQ